MMWLNPYISCDTVTPKFFLALYPVWDFAYYYLFFIVEHINTQTSINYRKDEIRNEGWRIPSEVDKLLWIYV